MSYVAWPDAPDIPPPLVISTCHVFSLSSPKPKKMAEKIVVVSYQVIVANIIANTARIPITIL